MEETRTSELAALAGAAHTEGEHQISWALLQKLLKQREQGVASAPLRADGTPPFSGSLRRPDAPVAQGSWNLSPARVIALYGRLPVWWVHDLHTTACARVCGAQGRSARVQHARTPAERPLRPKGAAQRGHH